MQESLPITLQSSSITCPSPCDNFVLPYVLQHNTFHHLAHPPSCEEVTNAISWMKNSKAPGPTGITADAFCAMIWHKRNKVDKTADDDTNFLIDCVAEILCLFWTGELDVAMWNKGMLSPAPKKGNLVDPNKQRPVCLLEILYKVLASILANRINPLAALESLEHFWQTESIPVLGFRWFPTCKNGQIKGCLCRQGNAK
eukprot:5327784-Ditylum_brightwellii.AAC.1